MIIGIAGTIGAGKGTVVEYLKSKGFVHYSSSQVLRDKLTEQGLPHIRDNLSPLATKIRAEDPAGLPKINYERYLKEKPTNAVFEALHTVGEAEFIKSIGGVIVGVDADIKIRYERTVGRGEERDRASFEDFQKQARIEDEGSHEDPSRDNNIRAIFKMADHVLINDGTKQELDAQIETVLWN